MVQRERNRLQRFFTFRRLQFALPHRNAMPAHLCQLALLLFVPLLVPSNLRHPELMVRLRNLATFRTLNDFFRLTSYIIHQVVSMPKATIHKDARPVFPQHQVRMPRQPFVVQPIAKAPTPQATSHNQLRFLCRCSAESLSIIRILFGSSRLL